MYVTVQRAIITADTSIDTSARRRYQNGEI
jgi:hypothetical protein